jgi:predicted ATPase/class 3 adenylate cyclase
LFTDLEVSTRLWDQEPDAMRLALARHDAILRDAVQVHGGHVVKGRGDGIHAVFATADAAVRAAIACEVAMDAEAWPVSEPLRVRVGLHTGVAELRDGDYFGSSVNRAARIMDLAHGGQIVCSQPTADLAREALPEGVGFVDLGEHRLRDLTRIERVFQVSAPVLPSEFAPLRSLDSFPSNLSEQLTSFVGRERELERIGETLRGARLVSLTGVGGVGKTRLAVQAGGEYLSEYPDGVWLCELAVAGDPDAMLQVIAAVLSVSPRADVPLVRRICDGLRAKRVLLVLDNCEHVLDAAADFVETVLRECSGVRVLATSREALDVPGERVMRVRSLPMPENADDWERVTSVEAVRLFVERASAVEPDFAVTRTNAARVVQICRRLDGIPLAIELAASRVVSLGAGEIAELLDERFRLLSGGRRTAVERHQTLRAAVDWSYSMLDATEQLVFDRLGIFAGAFDSAAADAVAGQEIDDWLVRDALASLVRKSMVNLVAVDDDTTRYQLLETLRAYARERLEERGEADEIRRRHARFYAQRGTQRGEAFLTGIGLDAVSRMTYLDTDDTRAALTWALDSPDPNDTIVAVQIGALLGGVGPAGRRDTGVIMNADRLLAHAEQTQSEFVIGILTGMASDALFSNGDADRAQELAVRASAAAAKTSDVLARRQGLVGASSVLAFTAMARGDFNEARRLVREGLDLVDADHERSWFEFHAARIEYAAGDRIEARRHAQAAIDLARRADFPLRLGQGLSALASATVRTDPLTARAALDEIADIVRANPYLRDRGAFSTVVPTVQLELTTGDYRGALAELREEAVRAREVAQSLKTISVAALSVHVLAHLGHPEPAARLAGVVTQGPYARLLGLVGEPEDRAELEKTIVSLRGQLDPESYAHATTTGASLSISDIIDTVIVAIDDATAAPATSG